MTILASDTFSRVNQSSWGTASDGESWSAPRGTGAYSIASNEGVNSANGGTFSVARIGSGTSASQEVLVRVNPADTTSDIGTIARFVDLNNFYYGVFESGNALIGKNVSGSFSTLNSAAFSYASGTFYWVRFNLVGSVLKLRAWQDGDSEPGAWTVTTTDASLTTGGYGLGSDATGSSSFDSLTVTDATITSLATLAQATFRVRAALATDSRATFKIRAVLAVQARSAFKIRAVLASVARGAFKVRAQFATEGRAAFNIRVALATRAHSTFKIRTRLATSARATWKIRAVLTTIGRATFKIKDVLLSLATLARVTFKIALGAALHWLTRDNQTDWLTRDNETTWKARD